MLSVKWVCVLIAPSLRSSASVEVVIEADPKDEAFELDASCHSVADQPIDPARTKTRTINAT